MREVPVRPLAVAPPFLLFLRGLHRSAESCPSLHGPLGQLSIPAYRVLSERRVALGRKGRDYWGGVLDEFSCAEGRGKGMGGGEEGFGRSLAGGKGSCRFCPCAPASASSTLGLPFLSGPPLVYRRTHFFFHFFFSHPGDVSRHRWDSCPLPLASDQGE